MHGFVALDLELTPFPGDQQRIIEIAAVRFRDGAIADRFSSLVNPGCALDARIGALTGIRQHQLDGAPTLAHLVPKLLSFLGSDAVVGQSINFDLEALDQWGVRVANESYDTFELASILLPGLPSYDLGTIARSLGVELEREHRAEGDAIVAGRVFLSLVERACDLSLEVLTQVNALATHLPTWTLAPIFAEALSGKLRAHFETGDQFRGLTPFALRRDQGASRSQGLELPFLNQVAPTGSGAIRPTEIPSPIDRAELAELMKPDGPVGSALSGFEERPEQLRMMESIAGALNEGGHLLVEAGTGTGKSLAYLLPSIYYSARNGRHVVISTNTVNLQDQLFHKDIPGLQEWLPVEFKAALLKGRANYLCLRRWQVLSRSPNLSRDEAMLLIKTLIWLAVTETGDRAELNLSQPDSLLWPRVSAQVESCARGRCHQFRRGNCFVLRARKAAETSNVIVVNHALLLSDLASGGVLPEYSHLIIDEAHHLEQEATEQLGFALGWGDLLSFLSGLSQMGMGFRPAGFLPELVSLLRAARLPQEETAPITNAISNAGSAVEAILGDARSFFDTLNSFLQNHAENRRHIETKLRVTNSARCQPGWAEVEILWAELAAKLQGLERHLHKIESGLLALEEGIIAERDGLAAELAGFRSFMERAVVQGCEIVSSPNSNGIYWIRGGSTLEDLALCSAPLHVGEALNKALFSVKDSVILTSATLTTEGCFDYVRERLSLDDASELVLGSPFDYQRSTLLYLVQDTPEPGRPTYQRAIDSSIADLVGAIGGRTLVLFTSHSQLRLTNSAIRSRLEEQGILVLAHAIDGSRRRLLQAFKSSPKAVLLGTSSFWEGIDVVGDALSCVVIVKLPFAVPTDPIFAARSESFDEPFKQYSVPQTILKFKQGFGRLIRSSTDRGVVAILDSRLRSKFYGPAFLQSVPRCTIKVGPAANMVTAASDWLRAEGAHSGTGSK